MPRIRGHTALAGAPQSPPPLPVTAWTWNAWGLCNSAGNDLILDNAGTPTSTFGEGFRAHLLTQQP